MVSLHVSGLASVNMYDPGMRKKAETEICLSDQAENIQENIVKKSQFWVKSI